MIERTYRLPHPVDIAATWAPVYGDIDDPTCRIGPEEIWRASRTPGGPATLRLRIDGDLLHATSWGDGAEATIEMLPDIVGAADTADDFRPDHDVVASLWERMPGCRVSRTTAVADALLRSVLDHSVTAFEASRAYGQLVAKWSEDAPGPAGLRLPPSPEDIAGAAHYDLHLCGVEHARADAVLRVVGSATRLDALAALPIEESRARLGAIPGVGAWSAGRVALVALGDPDAVPLGDPRLASDVTWALTGRAVDDDEAMLDVLAQFAGNRGRVVKLVMASGLRSPEHGPRYAPSSPGRLPDTD